MNISEKSKIYVACKPQAATGGPELCHQLVAKLKQIGKKAEMFYLKRMDDPIHENYKKYIDTYVFEIEDNRDNVLIVPETRTFELNKYQYVQKVIWWQSVDNYYGSRNRFKNRVLEVMKLKNFFRIENRKHHKDIVCHLLQSKYAELFLEKYGISNYLYLTDYIRQDFIDKSKLMNGQKKENLVLYNPRKGKKFTKKIIASFPEFNWVPLINLTPLKVADLISRAKVYIDFGNHPGRDRFPREAAALFNCVITGKRGAANNEVDIPIEAEFKFEDKEEEIQKIGKKIKDCLNKYDQKIMQFKDYRNTIYKQEETFDKEIKNCFLN